MPHVVRVRTPFFGNLSPWQRDLEEAARTAARGPAEEAGGEGSGSGDGINSEGGDDWLYGGAGNARTNAGSQAARASTKTHSGDDENEGWGFREVILIGCMEPEDVREVRRHLSWQPLFGACLRINYSETLDLTMEEVTENLEYIEEQRRAELKAAFGKGS